MHFCRVVSRIGREHIHITWSCVSSSHLRTTKCSPLEVLLETAPSKLIGRALVRPFFSFTHIYPIGLIWPNLDIWPSPIATQKKGHLGPFSILITMCLAKISAEALYPLACFFEVCIGGCIGNAEIWTKAEGRAVHCCHSFSGQQFADEVFVILNDFA